MPRIKHKEKVKIAKRMMTKEEKELNTSIFQCDGWLDRKAMIKARVLKSLNPKIAEKMIVKDIFPERFADDKPTMLEIKPQLSWYKRLWLWVIKII